MSGSLTHCPIASPLVICPIPISFKSDSFVPCPNHLSHVRVPRPLIVPCPIPISFNLIILSLVRIICPMSDSLPPLIVTCPIPFPLKCDYFVLCPTYFPHVRFPRSLSQFATYLAKHSNRVVGHCMRPVSCRCMAVFSTVDGCESYYRRTRMWCVFVISRLD